MNTNELITVVALADELHVAKQTIFYHCNKLQIEAKKVDNVSYLTHAEAEAIIQRIHKNNKRDTDKAEATKEDTTNQSELIKLLTKQIDDLKQDKEKYVQQLQVKDRQIEQLNNTLNEQQRLLSQQQSLQLQSNEKIKALEVELKEVKEVKEDKADTTDIHVPAEADRSQREVNDNKVDNFYKDLKEDRQNENNRSFLSRLFKR
ncbi:hypothetical protein [Macrococcus armenti]|uniref:hypothetical protein n=1 Tax=Macrococcus armenti TaxID=2875764 RepID=UPI001CCF2601|nr:hypothetical protein [Macrococcus armenti]UBH12223.1 hypothetical protein LAU43_06450 [Macrococcus armenti]